MVGSVVVAFMKLKKKVDVNKFENEVDGVYRLIGQNDDEVNRLINLNNEEIWNHVKKIESEIYRTLDSRCDKLDSKIERRVKYSEKELIKG